jgi:uncharacterized protein YyaL (SSP411 family)
MSRCDDKNRKQLMDFVLNTSFDEDCIHMDCTDGCEQIAALADRVASGEALDEIMPVLKEHMAHWKDCREEFDALVEIIRAEKNGVLSTELDTLLADLAQPPQPTDSAAPSAENTL